LQIGDVELMGIGKPSSSDTRIATVVDVNTMNVKAASRHRDGTLR
jgi:hypothetical protein